MANVKCNTLSDIYRPLLNAKLEEGWDIFENFVNEYFETDVVRQIMDEYNIGGVGNDSTNIPLEAPVEETKIRIDRSGQVSKPDVGTTLYYSDSSKQSLMERNFSISMISKCIVDPESLLKGENTVIASEHVGTAIYEYKKSLFNTIYDFIKIHGFEEDIDIESIINPLDREINFKKVLNYFSSNCIHTLKDDGLYDNVYEAFAILSIFDKLVERFAPYLEIDTRYKSPYSEDYYKYVGSKANHFQHVFGKDEYMSASDSMGELPKILLNNLPIVKYNKETKQWELVKDSSIGENAFHNIGSKLKQAIDAGKLTIKDPENPSIPLNVVDLLSNEVELTKLMPEIIEKFHDFITGSNSYAEEKTSLLDQLRAIQKLIYSESMPLEIRLIFTHNILKQVPSTYVSYTKKRINLDGELIDAIGPENLTERLIKIEQYILEEKIKAQSKYWTDNKERFTEIFEKLNIEIENTINGFKLKYVDKKSNPIQLRFTRSDKGVWTYTDEIVKENKNGGEYKNTRDLINRINTLWESIMYDQISSEFKSIFNNRKSDDSSNPILAHIPLLATVIDNVLKYNKDEGGNFKTCDFGSVKDIARTKAVISGADLKNVIKNGEGNNLPLYQMLCLAYRHTELHKKLQNEIEWEINDVSLQNNITFNNISSIIYPKIRTEVTVKDGLSSKTVGVTELSQQDVTHLAIGYDFLLPLFTNQNSVENQSSNKCILGFQTHCFSDKNKHFIMQFDITKPWNINGKMFNLKQLLVNFVKGKGIDQFKELKSAWRKSSELQYSNQIVNILLDFRSVFGDELNLDLYNKSLKENIELLTDFLRNKGLKFKDVVSRFEKAQVDFRNEITGCKSKSDEYLEFNETLLALYEIFSDENKFNKFYDTNLKKFISESQGAKNTITSDNLFKKLQDTQNIDFDKVWEAYYLMDTMFSTEYNKMMIGDVYMHPSKLKDSTVENGAINNFAKSKGKTAEEIEQLIETDSKIKSEFDSYKQNLKSTYSLANRWVAQVKRMVIFGATYHSYCTGMKEGIPEEVNIAIIEDMSDSVRSIAGAQNSELDAMDGSGFTSPYLSIMQNKSLLDAAVGKSKKTIYHDLGGRFGDPILLKWAEYELTTTMRRNSWASNVNAEKLFRKMHNRRFASNVSIQYEKQFDNPLIIENPYTHKQQSVYGIKIDGRIGHRLNQNGEVIESFEIDCIYDIDQLFGGAWVKQVGKNEETDYVETAIQETYEIICENNLKNYMVGILANKSAVKVGIRNLNSVSRWSNDEELWTSKMTLNFGGLQMDADHELDDAEVTEMTQMISALEQLGNTHGIATMVYEEIGKYCAESLKEITEALNKTDLKEKKDALYQIYGKALIKAFNSGNKDTLGLAQSFIKAAQQSINEYKITYQIPLSSASINGIFNSTVTSDIVKKAIRRHYDGIASVLHPGFNIMQYYTIDGINYRFEELAKVVNGDLKYLIENDDPSTNRYVIPVTNDQPVDFQDTIVIIDSVSGAKEVVTIDSYEKYLKYRNIHIPNKTIYRHTLRPKNLKGSDTIFEASVYSKDGQSGENQIMSVFETPESILLHFIKKLKIKDLKKEVGLLKSELGSILENNSKLKTKCIELCDEIVKEEKPERTLKKRLEKFLKLLSNIPVEGVKYEDILITHSKVIPAQIAMGRLYAKQLGLKSTDSVADILKKGPEFFEKRLYNQTDRKNKDAYSYDACLFREDGTPLYVKIGQFKGDLEKISSRIKQVPGEYQNIDGQIWVGDKQVCSADNKHFVKYINSEGTEFDLCIVDNVSAFENLKKSGLFEQIDYNFRIDNFEKIIDFRLQDLKKENGQYEYRSNLGFNLAYDGNKIITIGKDEMEVNERGNIYTDFDLLKQHVKTHKEKELFVEVLRTMNHNTLKWQNESLAHRRFEAFQKSLRFVGTRIPCQSMQSFAPMEIVMFTDSDVNEVYVPTMVCWLQGSDYDIDKQYLLGYSLSDNGTFSKSQSEWNKENLLKNKVVDGIFDVILNPSNQISLTMPVDTETIQNLAKNSSAGEAANRMTPYCPSSKFRMQIENMVGKKCIGNVATSIKSFFALSNLYNQRIEEAILLINEGNFELAKSYLKMYGKGLANVNVDKLRSISKSEDFETLIPDIELRTLILDVVKYQDNFDDVSMTLGELLNCATDNAKELVLKKINADSKWIDIYCVQLMLGENINTIGSFMMDPDIINLINEYDSSIFGEEQMDQSLFVTNKIKSFTQSIKRLEGILDDLKNNPSVSSAKIKSWINNYKEKNLPKFEEWSSKLDLENNLYHDIPSEVLNEMHNLFTKEYDEMVSIWNKIGPKYNKLFKCLNSAKEIQTLGKMLKINQGLETKFSDQLLRIHGVQKYIRTQAKNEKARHDDNLQKLIGEFDIYKFINDVEYQNEMIKAYEIVKSNFNILEVIATVPHFKEMFKTVSINKDVLCISALRNKLIFEAFSDPTINLTKETAKTIIESITDQINDEWLYSQQIQFPIQKGAEFIDGGGSKQTSVGDMKRTLSSSHDKRNFKTFIENTVIPLLKSKYPENAFVKNLEFGIKDLKFDSSGIDEVYLKLNINMMAVDNSIKNRAEYDEILKGFNALQFATVRFNEYSYNIVDLIFIYNLIVNKDRFGQTSFTRLFEDIINNDPEGKLYISKFNKWLDDQNPENFNLKLHHALKTYDQLNPELKDVDFESKVPNLTYDKDDSDSSEIDKFLSRLNLLANKDMGKWIESNKLNLDKFYSIEFELVNVAYADHVLNVNSIEPYLNGQRLILASNKEQLNSLSKIPAGKDIIVELIDPEGNSVKVKITKELGRLVSDNDLKIFGLRRKESKNDPSTENYTDQISENYSNDIDKSEFDSDPTLENIESSFTEQNETKIKLNDEQENAVNKAVSIIQSRTKKELLIQGKAGTGKTTLVNAIIEQFPNLNVTVLAPTNKAKNNIKNKVEDRYNVGFNTVASFLGNRVDVFGDVTEGSKISNSDIIVIDEVSMLSDEDRDKILKQNPFATIIYLGDEGQLPPVGKKPSVVFTSEDVERINLIERVRQGEESPILPLTDPFWNYSVNKETGPLPEIRIENVINPNGAVINSKSGSNNIVPKLMSSFIRSIEENDPDLVKIVTGTNKSVDAYNQLVKDNLVKLGYFKKIDNFDFSVGEMLIFGAPHKIGENLWIKNSEEFKIQSISEELEMNVNDEFGTKFLIDPIIKYREVSILVSGIEITIPVISTDSKSIFKKHKDAVFSDRRKGITEGIANKMTYLEHFANVNQIYAITAHKAQGSTYEICALDISNITGVGPDFWSNEEKAKCIYTGMTRPSNVLILLSNSSRNFDGNISEINDEINKNKSQKLIQSNTTSNVTQFEGKMTYSYGNNKRSDVKSETTIDAIRNGERTATTRYESDENIDYWKQAKVGDVIKFKGKSKEDYVLVRITKALTKLTPNTSAEEWSKKEGWSEEYFDKKVKSKLNQAWQIEFEYIGSNPVLSDDTLSIDSNPHTPELPKSTKLIEMVKTLNNPYIKLVHDEDLVNENQTIRNSKGFVRNGIVYINLDRMNAGSTLIHELGHLYLGQLKSKFGPDTSAIPEEVREYYKILEELKTLPLWKQLRGVEEYSDKYGSDFNEEIAARLIEQYFNGNLSTYREEQIAKKLLSLLDKEFRDLVETASNPQFMDNLMGFSENYEVQQKIASLKRRLYQDGSIKETDC